MKFLAFADLHDDQQKLANLFKRANSEDINFLVCAGDISNFGKGLKVTLKKLKELGKKVYFVPGNHEENFPLEELSREFPFFVNMHNQAAKLNGYILLGHGGGGFGQEDAQFRKIARKWYGNYKNEKIILLTHMPPYGSKVDLLNQQHVGNLDYRKFIERIKPKLVICGHLHETVGVIETFEKTKIINPGWDGMIVGLK